MNFKSIKNKLVLSFIAVGFLGVVWVLFTFWQFAGIISLNKKVLAVEQGTRIWTNHLSSGVHNANLALQNYISYQDDIYKIKRNEIWSRQILKALDSLEFYKGKWVNVEDVIVYKQIRDGLHKLNNKQGEIERSAEYDQDGAKARFASETLVLTDQIIRQINHLSENNLIASLRDSERVEKEISKAVVYGVIAFILFGLSAYLVYYYISRKILVSIKLVKEKMSVLSRGDLPDMEDTQNSGDELGIVLQEIGTLATNLRNVKDFALEVGRGKFDNEINVFNNSGEIGRSLSEMKDSLKKVADEDKQRNWINEGFTRFGDILRQNAANLNILADTLIINLVRYLKINQGFIFILNDENEEDPYMELKGAYAYEKKKFLSKEVRPKQGLVGQCWMEKESIYLKKVPAQYITITSGLGDANPDCLLLVPLKYNDQVFGIIELASFHAFKPYEIDFVERLSETIASTISNVRVNENTQRLLEESQGMTETMRAQEEEMRQNMEELQATQEEMLRVSAESNSKMNALNKALAVVEFDLNGSVVEANENFLSEMGYSADEIVGRHHRMFVLESERKSEDYRRFWQDLNEGKVKKGDFRRVKKGGETIWIKGSYSPVYDREGNLRRIVKYAFNITEDKKLFLEFYAKFHAVNLSLLTVEYDLAGNVMKANENFLTLMGYKKFDIIGKQHKMFLAREGEPVEENMELWKKMYEGEDVQGIFTFVSKIGRPLKLQGIYAPIKNIQGIPFKVIQVVSYIPDENTKKTAFELDLEAKHALEIARLFEKAQELDALQDKQMDKLLEKLKASEAKLKHSIQEQELKMKTLKKKG
jgi:PAS domain S-box-containing protein